MADVIIPTTESLNSDPAGTALMLFLTGGNAIGTREYRDVLSQARTGIPNASATTPVNTPGSPSAGSSAAFSRGDHDHGISASDGAQIAGSLPQSVTGAVTSTGSLTAGSKRTVNVTSVGSAGNYATAASNKLVITNAGTYRLYGTITNTVANRAGPSMDVAGTGVTILGKINPYLRDANGEQVPTQRSVDFSVTTGGTEVTVAVLNDDDATGGASTVQTLTYVAVSDMNLIPIGGTKGDKGDPGSGGGSTSFGSATNVDTDAGSGGSATNAARSDHSHSRAPIYANADHYAQTEEHVRVLDEKTQDIVTETAKTWTNVNAATGQYVTSSLSQAPSLADAVTAYTGGTKRTTQSGLDRAGAESVIFRVPEGTAVSERRFNGAAYHSNIRLVGTQSSWTYYFASIASFPNGTVTLQSSSDKHRWDGDLTKSAVYDQAKLIIQGATANDGDEEITLPAGNGGGVTVTRINPSTSQDDTRNGRAEGTVWSIAASGSARTGVGNISDPSDGDVAFYRVYSASTRDTLFWFIYSDGVWYELGFESIGSGRTTGVVYSEDTSDNLLNNLPNWVQGGTYSIYTPVVYNNNIYRAISEILDSQTTPNNDATNWQRLTIDVQFGNSVPSSATEASAVTVTRGAFTTTYELVDAQARSDIDSIVETPIVPAWVQGNSYVAGELVVYHERVWRAVTDLAVSNDHPVFSNHWMSINGWAGQWTSGRYYTVGDYVSDALGNFYMAHQDSAGLNEPRLDTTHWHQFAPHFGGFKGQWQPNITYFLGENVIQHGEFYRCQVTSSNSNQGPRANQTDWEPQGTWYDDWEAAHFAPGNMVKRNGGIYIAMEQVAFEDPAPDHADNTKWRRIDNRDAPEWVYNDNVQVPSTKLSWSNNGQADRYNLGLNGRATHIPAATETVAGVMTAEDKAKLDGIAEGATAGSSAIPRFRNRGEYSSAHDYVAGDLVSVGLEFYSFHAPQARGQTTPLTANADLMFAAAFEVDYQGELRVSLDDQLNPPDWVSTGVHFMHNRHDWASGESYSEENIVRRNGTRYVCLLPHTATAANAPGQTVTPAVWETW